MSTKKNDRPSVGAPGRPDGSGACEASTDPVSQSTTSPPPGQAVHIADFLLPGQQNSVSLKQLKKLLNLDGRTIRLMIRAERLAGTPILADNQTGYFLPGNDRERARRAAEIVKAADAIEGADI